MENCKKEFLEEVGDKEVLCADIQYGHEYWDNTMCKFFVLPVEYTEGLKRSCYLRIILSSGLKQAESVHYQAQNKKDHKKRSGL